MENNPQAIGCVPECVRSVQVAVRALAVGDKRSAGGGPGLIHSGSVGGGYRAASQGEFAGGLGIDRSLSW